MSANNKASTIMKKRKVRAKKLVRVKKEVAETKTEINNITKVAKQVSKKLAKATTELSKEVQNLENTADNLQNTQQEDRMMVLGLALVLGIVIVVLGLYIFKVFGKWTAAKIFDPNMVTEWQKEINEQFQKSWSFRIALFTFVVCMIVESILVWYVITGGTLSQFYRIGQKYIVRIAVGMIVLFAFIFFVPLPQV